MLRISIIQPYLPHYSAAFFEKLAQEDSIQSMQIIADLETNGHLHTVNRSHSVELSHIPFRSHGPFIYRPGRLQTILAFRPDVCVLSADPRDLAGLLLAVFLRACGIKVIFWGMFHRIGGPKLISQIFYKQMGQIANACITYARAGAFNLLSLGTPGDKVFIGGTAIDESKPFHAASQYNLDDIDRFKREQGLAGKSIILQVVRLSKIKKPLLILELALALIKRGRSNFVIVIIGGGEMLEALRNRMEQLDLCDLIKIFPPEYNEENLAKWFLSADVFTIPTCIGLSAHHAFSYGLPIITDDSLTDQASEFEVIVHGLNGLTYQAGNIQSYASAVETIIDDPSVRARMSQNALDTIRNNYSLTNKVKAFETVFNSVAGTPKK